MVDPQFRVSTAPIILTYPDVSGISGLVNYSCIDYARLLPNAFLLTIFTSHVTRHCVTTAVEIASLGDKEAPQACQFRRRKDLAPLMFDSSVQHQGSAIYRPKNVRVIASIYVFVQWSCMTSSYTCHLHPCSHLAYLMEAVRTGNISITLSPFFVSLFHCHLTVLAEPLCQDFKRLVKTSGGSLWLDSF